MKFAATVPETAGRWGTGFGGRGFPLSPKIAPVSPKVITYSAEARADREISAARFHSQNDIPQQDTGRRHRHDNRDSRRIQGSWNAPRSA